MSDSITINGNKMVFVPTLMRWCMACTKGTFDEETRDASARMFALSGFLPDLTAGQLRDIATGRMTWTADEDANTLTLTPTPDSK